MAEVRSWRERKEKAFNLKSKQEVRFDRVVSVQERTQAALWRQPEREHPMPRTGHNCSASILLPSHTPAPTFHSLVIPCLLLCVYESDAFSTLLTASCIQTWQRSLHWPVGPAQILCLVPQVLSSGWTVFAKGNTILLWTRPGFWRQSWLLPTCKGYSWTVSAVGSPRPGSWLAWFPKASTLAAESNDKN